MPASPRVRCGRNGACSPWRRSADRSARHRRRSRRGCRARRHRSRRARRPCPWRTRRARARADPANGCRGSLPSRTPAWSRRFAMRSVPRFVLQKTIVGPASLMTSAQSSTRLSGWTLQKRCVGTRLVDRRLRQRVAHRVALVSAHERVDRAVERRREQQRLAGLRRGVEQALHDGQEAHVGHAVGFVDDHDLDRVEADLAALDQVGEAARAGDEDVDTTAEGLQLQAEAGAAVHGRDPQLALPAEPLELTADLRGELAGGNEDEAGRALGRRTRDPHGERDPEGDGLARSGRGAAAEVATGAAVGDGEGLDGEGGEDPACLQGGDELRGHAEIGEGGGH